MAAAYDAFDSIADASSLGVNGSRALIEQARNGCDEALAELITSMQGYLLAIANAELNAQLRGKVGASDLVQSVLLRAGQNLAEFRGDSRQNLLAWLRTILTNEIIAAHRRYVASEKRDVRREVPLPTGSGQEHPPAAAGGSPRSHAERNEDALRLRQAMERLSGDHRTVVVLRNWEQLPFEEIGQRMNRSTDAAKKLWQRAIRELEQELKDA